MLLEKEMRKWIIKLFWLLLLLQLSSCALEPVAPGKLVTEEFMLPASFVGTSGPYIANLDAMVIRPDDAQRHPLAVINHGTDGRAPKKMSPKEMRGMAQEFARRGWVAIIFTRRGYGKSDGLFEDGPRKYTAADYERVGRAGASDIREVIRLMADKPYVDAARVISVGVSGGGFATVALTADPPPGLVAGINFAGGQASALPNGSGFTVHNESALLEVFGRFGKTSRIPMLWVYALNDSHFGPALAKQAYAIFTEAGGKAEFVAAPALGVDGHALFIRMYASIWTRYVDAFLLRKNMKLMDGLIAVEDEAGVDYPPHMSPAIKATFLDYLDAGDHKAFAMSYAQGWSWVSKQVSGEAAAQNALKGCATCFVVSIDGHAP